MVREDSFKRYFQLRWGASLPEPVKGWYLTSWISTSARPLPLQRGGRDSSMEDTQRTQLRRAERSEGSFTGFQVSPCFP